jgi:uncharacterized protein
MSIHLSCLVCGLFGGTGLAVAGLEQPGVILHAFTYGPDWDPRLWLFFAGAIAVTVPMSVLIRRRGMTASGAPLPRPSGGRVDFRLVAGAALFGLGWGLAGVCPGPAVTSLAAGTVRAVLLALSLGIGILIGHAFGGSGRTLRIP